MEAATVTREQGEAARDAALAISGVAGLHGGRIGEVALLLPGERIEGVRPVHRGEGMLGIEVHVVFDVSSERPIQDVADDIRAAVAEATDLDFVDIVVADAQ